MLIFNIVRRPTNWNRTNWREREQSIIPALTFTQQSDIATDILSLLMFTKTRSFPVGNVGISDI